ncbi:DNA adenine methylase [Spiroplasma endosymbiont of Nebria brevicollis]|uniref:DNA adenine methylase n=1 Tax=Spiroplasma endosymbiont of Nebria brevicollis TaxID=3066284 RepID=UPI00313BDC4F
MKKIYNRRYMGGKNKIIPHIINIINNLNIEFSTFYEPFGGTGVVSYELAKKFELKTVYINDFLSSNFIIYNAVFGHRKCDYNKLNNLIKAFNSNDYFDNYFVSNFGNKFFSNETADKIGGIRQKIQEFYDKKEINYYEFCSLITSLIYFYG